MTLRKTLSEIKIQNAVDQADESEFIGDDEIEDDLLKEAREEARELINIKQKNDIKPVEKKKKDNWKITQEEKRLRIREIIEVSNRGFTYSEVVDYGVKRWGCAERTVERYISEARKIEAVPEKDLKEYRSDSLSRCLYVYKLAIKNKSEGTALQAIKEMNKLLGLYSEQIIQTQGSKENPIEKMMRELEKNTLSSDDILDDAIGGDEYGDMN